MSAATTEANSITISSLPYWNNASYLGPDLGEPLSGNGGPVPIWGQTFTVPNNYQTLTTFGVWMDNLTPNPLIFGGYVMQWNGHAATGPVLYSSGPVTLTSDWSIVLFSPDVTLTPGEQYVFLFNVSGYADGLDRRARLSGIAYDYSTGLPIDAYTGGGVGYPHPGTDVTDDWGSYVTWDTAFFADFSSQELPVSVPDTANVSLLIISGAFLGFEGLRRKRATRSLKRVSD